MGAKQGGRTFGRPLSSIISPQQCPVAVAAVDFEHIVCPAVSGTGIKIEKAELNLRHPAFRLRNKCHGLLAHIRVVSRIRGRSGTKAYRIQEVLDIVSLLAVIDVFHLDGSGLLQCLRFMLPLIIVQCQAGASGTEIVPVLGIVADSHFYIEIIAAFRQFSLRLIYLNLNRMPGGQTGKRTHLHRLGSAEGGVLPHEIDFAAFHKADRAAIRKIQVQTLQ